MTSIDVSAKLDEIQVKVVGDTVELGIAATKMSGRVANKFAVAIELTPDQARELAPLLVQAADDAAV